MTVTAKVIVIPSACEMIVTMIVIVVVVMVVVV